MQLYALVKIRKMSFKIALNNFQQYIIIHISFESYSVIKFYICVNFFLLNLILTFVLFFLYFQKPITPWMSIFRSVPVWALLATQCAQSWGFWMLLTEIPSYMTSIMRFDIQKVNSCNLINNHIKLLQNLEIRIILK